MLTYVFQVFPVIGEWLEIRVFLLLDSLPTQANDNDNVNYIRDAPAIA